MNSFPLKLHTDRTTLLELFMGFTVQIPEDEKIVERLKADPGSFFSRIFPGYLLFLFDRFDKPWPDWMRTNASALDQETGGHIAFAMFAITTRLTVRSSQYPTDAIRPWELQDPRFVKAEFNPEDLGLHGRHEGFSVTRIVGSGAFGWLEGETVIEAVNSAVRFLSEQFRVKDRMPCIIVLDAIPSNGNDFKVIELSSFRDNPDLLFIAIRKAVGIFQGHRGYSNYRDAVQRLRCRSDELAELEIRSANTASSCSLPRQVDSEDVEFSACCLNNLGGNFPSAPWGRSSL